MLRILLLFLCLVPLQPAGAQQPSTPQSVVYTATPSVSVEVHGDNVYLVGRGLHVVPDTSGRFSIGGAAPLYTGIVTFQFANGSFYQYTPKYALPQTSFAVLLRGEVELPTKRHGIGRLFEKREHIHGDQALLHWLQTRELQTVRYEQEDIGYWNNRKVKTNRLPKTYSNPTEFADTRNKLNRSMLQDAPRMQKIAPRN